MAAGIVGRARSHERSVPGHSRLAPTTCAHHRKHRSALQMGIVLRERAEVASEGSVARRFLQRMSPSWPGGKKGDRGRICLLARLPLAKYRGRSRDRNLIVTKRPASERTTTSAALLFLYAGMAAHPNDARSRSRIGAGNLQQLASGQGSGPGTTPSIRTRQSPYLLMQLRERRLQVRNNFREPVWKNPHPSMSLAEVKAAFLRYQRAVDTQ